MYYPEISKSSKWSFFLLVLFVLFCFAPYEFRSTYLLFLPDKEIYSAGILFVLLCFILFLSSSSNYIFDELKTIIGLQIFGFIIVGLFHGNIMPVFRNTLMILLAIQLINLICSKIGLEVYFKLYNRWILIMSILGTITFFLVTFKGWNPLYFITSKDGFSIIYNYGLTFTKSSMSYGQEVFRYAGFFDEPGAIGYWGMYALIINKLFIKDLKIEIALIICLFFTFSMGFYIQLIVYLFLFNMSSIDFSKRVFMLLGVFLIAFGIYSTKDTEFDNIYNFTYGRFEGYLEDSQTSSSATAVGNRAELEELAKDVFLEEPIFGSERAYEIYMSNNIYEPLARYGIFGSLLLYSPYLFLLFRSIKRSDSLMMKALLVMITGFIHRPFHTDLLYFFIIYSIITMYLFRNEYNDNQIEIYDYES